MDRSSKGKSVLGHKSAHGHKVVDLGRALTSVVCRRPVSSLVAAMDPLHRTDGLAFLTAEFGRFLDKKDEAWCRDAFAYARRVVALTLVEHFVLYRHPTLLIQTVRDLKLCKKKQDVTAVDLHLACFRIRQSPAERLELAARVVERYRVPPVHLLRNLAPPDARQFTPEVAAVATPDDNPRVLQMASMFQRDLVARRTGCFSFLFLALNSDGGGGGGMFAKVRRPATTCAALFWRLLRKLHPSDFTEACEQLYRYMDKRQERNYCFVQAILPHLHDATPAPQVAASLTRDSDTAVRLMRDAAPMYKLTAAMPPHASNEVRQRLGWSVYYDDDASSSRPTSSSRATTPHHKRKRGAEDANPAAPKKPKPAPIQVPAAAAAAAAATPLYTPDRVPPSIINRYAPPKALVVTTEHDEEEEGVMHVLSAHRIVSPSRWEQNRFILVFGPTVVFMAVPSEYRPATDPFSLHAIDKMKCELDMLAYDEACLYDPTSNPKQYWIIRRDFCLQTDAQVRAVTKPDGSIDIANCFRPSEAVPVRMIMDERWRHNVCLALLWRRWLGCGGAEIDSSFQTVGESCAILSTNETQQENDDDDCPFWRDPPDPVLHMLLQHHVLLHAEAFRAQLHKWRMTIKRSYKHDDHPILAHLRERGRMLLAIEDLHAFADFVVGMLPPEDVPPPPPPDTVRRISESAAALYPTV